MFLFTTPSLPSLSPERREAIALLWNRTVQAFLWAVALTYTAGRLTRIGFEWARPHIAKALHALAIALDKALLYPDQPEPDPTPDPDPELAAFAKALLGDEPEHGTFVLQEVPPVSAGPKPRAARRRTTRAAA